MIRSIHRRRLVGCAASLAAAALNPLASNAAARSLPTGVRMGLILKMKEDLQTDWQGTLKKVSALGVKDIEFPGTLGPSAEECRKVLDALGLCALGGGAVYKELDAELDQVLATSHVLGKKFVYCYWPWLDGGMHKTADDWKRLAQTLNQLGARVRAGGLKLAYHNHDMEFVRVGGDGPFPYDLLMDHTDPALMTMQMDLFWVQKSGQSPLPFLKRHKGRVSSFHIKERLNTKEGDMLCSGESFDNLGTTLKAGVRAGVKHFVIENENPKDNYGCVRQTLAFVSSQL